MNTDAPTTTAESPRAGQGFSSRASPNEPNSLAVFTLVVWLVCSIIGALGFVLRYERPRPPTPPEQPILAQQLQVELAPKPLPAPETEARPPDPRAPPPSPDVMSVPPMPQPIAVAQPSPTIAFAIPVDGPTRIVETSRAEYFAPPVTKSPAPAAAPPVQQLTFGEGEGKQPAPEYPPSARRQGQEGTVVVRLTVGTDGRVLVAKALVASPWALLNEAALRTVREKWRFRAGSPRIYDVAVRFELTK